jgi:hypothetical protein
MKSKPEKRAKMPASKFTGTGAKTSPAPKADNLKKKSTGGMVKSNGSKKKGC